MADAKLGIIINADVGQAQAGLTQLSTKLENVSTSVNRTEAAAVNLGQSLDKVKASTSQAASGLTNVSQKATTVGAAFQSVKAPVLDVASAFEQATARINASIDKMVDDALKGSSAVSTTVTRNYMGMGAGIGGVFDKIRAKQDSVFSTGRGLNSYLGSIESASGGLAKFAKQNNSATQASINLGRVIQDAPFGFLGIANNLNPLLESFQRLKAQSGSTGTALKALGGSLMGAGGLGLAVSLISTGLIVFGDRLFGASKAAKVAKEDTERLASVLKDLNGTIGERRQIAIAGTADETARVQLLSQAVLDQTKSYNERNNALNQLKEINKNYFGDLTLEGDKLSVLRARVEEYTSAIIAAATVRAFSDDIGKLNVELSKQLIVYNKIGNTLDENKKKLANTSEFYTSLTGEERSGSAAFNKLTRDIKNGTKELAIQGAVIKDLADKSTDFKGALKGAVEESLKFKPLTTPTVTGTTKIKPDKVEFEFDKIKLDRPIPIEGKFIPFGEIEKSDYDKMMEGFQKKFGNDQKLDLPLKINFTVEAQANNDFAEKFRKDFARTIKIGDIFGVKQEDKDNPLTKLEKQSIFAAQSINNVLQPAFQNLFESIKSGESPLKAFFQGLGQAVGQLIQKLIQAAITAAILSAIFPGGFGGVQGFGKIFGSLLGFAGGGRPPVGVPSLVGERGPEIFIPDTAGRIVPNNMLGNMSGLQPAYAGSGGGSLTTELSGDTLRLWIDRATRKQNRSFGR